MGENLYIKIYFGFTSRKICILTMNTATYNDIRLKRDQPTPTTKVSQSRYHRRVRKSREGLGHGPVVALSSQVEYDRGSSDTSTSGRKELVLRHGRVDG